MVGQLGASFSTRVKKPLYRHTRWYSMTKYETQRLANWHHYKSFGGKMEFEEFYSRSLQTQSMLVRMRKWRHQ